MTSVNQRNIVLGVFTGSHPYYPEYPDNTKARPGIYFDVEYDLYYFTYGPPNTPNKRIWPRRTDGDDVLEETQPLYFYNNTQLDQYIFIVEIVDPRKFRVYNSSYLPSPPPFFIYEMLLDDTEEEDWNDPKQVRIRNKLKVIDVTDNVLTTETDHNLEETNNTENFPIIGFWNRPIDDLLGTVGHIPKQEELGIQIMDRWQQWSLRPHSFHQLDPLRAFTYSNVYGWNWGWPLPYPECTYDWEIDEPPTQYGYETPRIFENSKLVFRPDENLWYPKGQVAYPFMTALAHSELVSNCFIDGKYFKMTNDKKYQIHRKIWS